MVQPLSCLKGLLNNSIHLKTTHGKFVWRGSALSMALLLKVSKPLLSRVNQTLFYYWSCQVSRSAWQADH